MPTDRSINYLRSVWIEKMSGEVPNWWNGLAEELQIDIESIEGKDST